MPQAKDLDIVKEFRQVANYAVTFLADADASPADCLEYRLDDIEHARMAIAVLSRCLKTAERRYRAGAKHVAA